MKSISAIIEWPNSADCNISALSKVLPAQTEILCNIHQAGFRYRLLTKLKFTVINPAYSLLLIQ